MYGPMKKRNIPVILLLPLLSLSCSLSHKMERSISKVGLSQAGKRPAPDTTCYSVPEKITWKDSSGVEHIVTMAERDSVTGEEMTVLQLDEVTIVARNRNIPERAGKVNLDFVVTVPGRLIDDKWQVQLTPVAYKRGRRIELPIRRRLRQAAEKRIRAVPGLHKQHHPGFRLSERDVRHERLPPCHGRAGGGVLPGMEA